MKPIALVLALTVGLILNDAIAPSHASSSSTACAGRRANATDRRADARARAATFGTFNAKFLFDGINDVSMSPYAGNTADGVNRAQAHAEAIARVVRMMACDVVVVAEVETCETLASAADGDAHSAHLVPGTDTVTQQQVGLLTKIDIERDLERTEGRGTYDGGNSRCGYANAKESGVSKHFWTRVKVVDRYVSIIGAHLKANPTEASSCAQREAQVEVLRGLARSRYEAGDAVVVLGDLNDYSDDVVDADGNVPTSQCIARLRDFNGDGVDEMVEVSSKITRSSRFTYRSNDSYTRAMIDHILVSKADIIVVSAVIRHDLVTSTSVSDHFPLVATLNFLAARNESLLSASSAAARDVGSSSIPFSLVVALVVALALQRVAASH